MSEKFRFDSPVVLVGGADVNPSLLRRLAHLPLIAADGGANHLRHSSLVPQLVIGDLDSVTDKDHWQSVSKVVELSEQDSTDFEKCLYSIDAPLFIAIGFSGNRLDHTLATLHVMQKLYRKKRVVLAGDDDVVCVCSEKAEVNLPVGTRVSIYPLNRVVFETSSGLLYPLNDLDMQPGQLIGTSNASTESQVVIKPKNKSPATDGCYALILPSSQLKAMTDMLLPQVPAI